MRLHHLLPLTALCLLSVSAHAQDADSYSDASTTADTSDTTDKGDTTDDTPEPTLTIDGTSKGSLTVSKGDVVLLTGEVTKDVEVDGGVLIVDGGVIGRDLVVYSGQVELIDGSVDRDLDVYGGDLVISDFDVDRDADFDFFDVLAVWSSADGGGGLTAGRDISLVADKGLSFGMDAAAGRDFSVDAGGEVDITGAITADRDLLISASGDSDVEQLECKGGVPSDDGLVDLFDSKGASRITGDLTGQTVVVTTNGSLALQSTVTWGRRYDLTGKTDAELSATSYTYDPTSPDPRIDFFYCLDDGLGG